MALEPLSGRRGEMRTLGVAVYICLINRHITIEEDSKIYSTLCSTSFPELSAERQPCSVTPLHHASEWTLSVNAGVWRAGQKAQS